MECVLTNVSLTKPLLKHFRLLRRIFNQIKVNHINKFFNKGKNNQIHVLNDVSLTLPEKGLVVILGASGSGKTTLLNVIGGLDKVESGQIDFFR